MLDYWFVMGYLVGDGWIEETTKEEIDYTINVIKELFSITAL